MDEVGSQMLTVEMSIEDLIDKYQRSESERKKLESDNMLLVQRQNEMEGQIKKLMARVQLALSKLDSEGNYGTKDI